MKFLLIVLLGVCWASTIVVAQQVEHNYVVGPQNTDCDSLDISGLSTKEAVSLIRRSKFRLDQKFSLNRPSGLMSGAFYSCDNRNGFLVIIFDRKGHLFLDVPLSIWDDFVSSTDPEDFYLQEINGKYKKYTSQSE